MELQLILTSAHLLNYQDYGEKFLVTTDASIEALGVVLSQGPAAKDSPIAYASRTLKPAEAIFYNLKRAVGYHVGSKGIMMLPI